jgi:predicted  nucleic acid-binding Zn-ribbon protein
MENPENTKSNPNNENAVTVNKLKNARKEGLKKGSMIAAIISLIVIGAAAVFVHYFYNKEHVEHLAQIELQRNSFTEKLTERDSLINEWLYTFDQIENDLGAIKQKENIISIKSSDSELTKNRREQVLEDIKYINTLIESNKQKIASLSAQLKKSGGTIKGLQDKIASLETSLKEYETEITDLKTTLVQKDFEIGQLNTKMTDLDFTVKQQTEKINNQTQKMNAGYLASGTYKDLKGKGIVTKEGGFLGLGRKESLVENVSDSLFSKVDVTETKVIPVNSKDAKFITSHPASSYEMIREGNKGIAYIEIKDPEQFWKISKYAVVEFVR